jgi:glycosyltransferase involved in cell wall biosynthesis
VLLLSPITPTDRGNGLSMRAGLFLEALSPYDVSLVVVPVSGPPPAQWPTFVLDRTVERACIPLRTPAHVALTDGGSAPAGWRDVAVVRSRLQPALSRLATVECVEEAGRAFNGRPAFDIVIVMRSYLAPFLTAFRGSRRRHAPAILDLDDDEVTTRRRLAVLHASAGRSALSQEEAAEADRYRILEAAWLPCFDHLLVCSEHDRAVVAERTAHRAMHVIPNGVVLPDEVSRIASREDSSARLLFVGSLGYAPNVDAASVLCREILPRLRARVGREVGVDLVGSQPTSAVLALGRIEGVSVHADVPDVAPYYRRAHLAVVPIRAGGGTRLKILEAFAHGVPVVSTSIGAEGLDAIAERHLLIADEPTHLVDACQRLLASPPLAARLRTEARSLVQARYEISVVAQRIRSVVDAAAAATPQ